MKAIYTNDIRQCKLLKHFLELIFSECKDLNVCKSVRKVHHYLCLICCCVSLVKFSFWSKFHVSIIIGSGVMTTFVCKRLTRNSEIRNTPARVLPNVWRLGQTRN